MPGESYNVKPRTAGEIVIAWRRWTFEGGFAQVPNVGEATDEDEQELEEDGADSSNAKTGDSGGPSIVWHAMPVWRLFVFALVGGAPYFIYWMYRAWSAYRASWGYSRAEEWQAVYRRTGFRVSPAWRAILMIHCYCLFAAVKREAAMAGVRAGLRPWSMFATVWLACWLGLGGSLLGLALQHLLLALVIVPAQAAINRLSERAGEGAGDEPVTGAEVVWLVIGVLLTWWSINGAVAS